MSDRTRGDGPDATTDRFHALMARLDGPMLVVTTRDDLGERSGCLVGFSTQCSIDPPRFLVCLSNKNRTFRVAEEAPVLAVHLLPEGRSDLADLFGGETGDEVDKFARVPWREGPAGVPLLDDCPAWFAGTVLARHELGDHIGFLLDPIAAAGGTGNGGGEGDRVARLHEVDDVDPGHEA